MKVDVRHPRPEKTPKTPMVITAMSFEATIWCPDVVWDDDDITPGYDKGVKRGFR